VNDRVAWSVGLSVGLSPSEFFRKFGSDRDTLCVYDSVGPGKDLLHIADHVGRILYCVHSTQYNLLVNDIIGYIPLWIRNRKCIA